MFSPTQLGQSSPRWHMLPALGGVLLLHAALLYGITRSEPVQVAGGDDVPISVDIVEAPYQPPVIPEPSYAAATA